MSIPPHILGKNLRVRVSNEAGEPIALPIYGFQQDERHIKLWCRAHNESAFTQHLAIRTIEVLMHWLDGSLSKRTFEVAPHNAPTIELGAAPPPGQADATSGMEAPLDLEGGWSRFYGGARLAPVLFRYTFIIVAP